MDGTDLEILQLLVKSPQEPFYRIAKKVGVSPRTVQRKVQKMKEAGMIHCFSIIIALSKIGYQSIVNMVNTIKQLPSVEKVETDFVTETQFPATTKFTEQLTPEKPSSS